MKYPKLLSILGLTFLIATGAQGQTTPIDNIMTGPHILAEMKNIKVETALPNINIKFQLYLSASKAYVDFVKPANEGGQGADFGLESIDLAFDLELGSYTTGEYILPSSVSTVKMNNQIATIQGLNNVRGDSPASFDSRFKLSLFRNLNSTPLSETPTMVAEVSVNLPIASLDEPDQIAKLVLRCAQTGFGTGLSGSKWNDFSGHKRNVVGSAAPSKPLPVTLVSFNALPENNIVAFLWKTSEETNSDRFEVQRSANGRGWATLQTVKALGESKAEHEYKSVDAAPLAGNNLYRLRMIDRDGSDAFSKIVNVRIEQEADYVFPNPATDRIYLKSKNPEAVSSIDVRNENGFSVLKLSRFSSEGIDLKTLTPGLYTIKVSSESATRDFKVAVVK